MFRHKYMKDKNFLLFFFGILVSGVGSRIYGFGIALYLLDLTGKATVTATYIAIWSFVVFLISPIAATFTDRWKNKVRVLYVTDFARGILYAISAGLVFYFTKIGNPEGALVSIYILLVFIGIQTAFFSPATSAIVPQIVDEDELVSSSSMFQLTRSLQNVMGLMFGAFLYVTFGIVPLMLINAISFILSGISEMFIRYDIAKNAHKMEDYVDENETIFHQNKIYDTVIRIFKDLKEAIVYVVKDARAILMLTLIILISMTLSTPWFSVGVPYMIKEYFAFTVAAPEYILASSEFIESMGVILLSLVVASIASKFKIYQLLRFGAVSFTIVGIILVVIVRQFDYHIISEWNFLILFVSINFIAGGVNALINAPINASLQKYILPDKIGKVSALIDLFGGMIFPVTAILAGFLIDNYSLYYPMVLMVFAMVLISVIAFRSKLIKHLE